MPIIVKIVILEHTKKKEDEEGLAVNVKELYFIVLSILCISSTFNNAFVTIVIHVITIKY